MSKQPRVNDFFCGCGGMGLGFKYAGYETAGAWDYDKFAVESYSRNVDSIVKQLSILDMHFDDVPHADVWTFGFPCQDLSIAGLQKGLYEGERSRLFFEVMRLLDEADMMGMEKPKVIMAENVKALRPYLPVLEEEYSKRGYKAQYILYNSKYWDVPQNRERYFVLGVREDIKKEFIFPQQGDIISKILLDVLDQDVEESYYISDEKSHSLIEQALKNAQERGVDISYTRAMTETRTETRTEEARRIRRESMSEGRDFSPRRGKEVKPRPDEVANCCTTTITVEQYLLEPKIIVAGSLGTIGTSSEHNNRVYDPAGIAPTATAVAGGTHHIKIIVPEATRKGYAIAEVGDSINLSHPKSKTRRGRVGVGVGVAQTLLTGCEQCTIDPETYRVRKLTPTEYGRLQGFPMDDGWEQVVSNAQAYKQFGNAVTVNVAEVIAQAIKEQLLEE